MFNKVALLFLLCFVGISSQSIGNTYHFEFDVFGKEITIKKKKKTIERIAGNLIAKKLSDDDDGILIVSGISEYLDGEYKVNDCLVQHGSDQITSFLAFKDGKTISWSWAEGDKKLQAYDQGTLHWFEAKMIRSEHLDGAVDKENPADGSPPADVFTILEKMPEFPGGEGELFSYLGSNVTYSKKARKNKISGKVNINFIVDTDGSITNVWVVRGIGGGCDEPALEVVKKMPNWEPGTQRGVKVQVRYFLPISFKLN